MGRVVATHPTLVLSSSWQRERLFVERGRVWGEERRGIRHTSALGPCPSWAESQGLCPLVPPVDALSPLIGSRDWIVRGLCQEGPESKVTPIEPRSITLLVEGKVDEVDEGDTATERKQIPVTWFQHPFPISCSQVITFSKHRHPEIGARVIFLVTLMMEGKMRWR